MTNNKVTELQDTIKSYEAVRTAINLECASADPSVKLERLQKVFMGLKVRCAAELKTNAQSTAPAGSSK